jgi:hypothetical protein
MDEPLFADVSTLIFSFLNICPRDGTETYGLVCKAWYFQTIEQLSKITSIDISLTDLLQWEHFLLCKRKHVDCNFVGGWKFLFFNYAYNIRHITINNYDHQWCESFTIFELKDNAIICIFSHFPYIQELKMINVSYHTVHDSIEFTYPKLTRVVCIVDQYIRDGSFRKTKDREERIYEFESIEGMLTRMGIDEPVSIRIYRPTPEDVPSSVNLPPVVF